MMRTVVLSDVAEVKLGRQRSPKHHSGDQMRPYVRAANVGWQGWKFDDVKSMNFSDSEMQIYRLEPGDLLLNEASGSAAEVGKPALWEGQIPNCAFQNTLIRVRPGAAADSRYLLHYFSHCAASGRFARSSRGVGIFHLGRKALAEWPVPLPAVEEQRRIAAVLDAADALRAKRRDALAKLDTLTQAIFMEMFGTPEVNVHDFAKRRIGEVAEVKGGKRLPKGSVYSAGPTAYPYIRVTDFNDGVVDARELRYLTEEVHSAISSYTVAAGDVIISIAGSIGQVATVPAALDGANLTENAAKLVRKSTDELATEYLANCLQTHYVQNQISARTGRVTIGKLALFRIESIEILIPPLELQQDFEERVAVVEAMRARAKETCELMENLFASIQHRAFRGEL